MTENENSGTENAENTVSEDTEGTDNSENVISEEQDISVKDSAEVPQEVINKNLQWFAVHAYSGLEAKAKQALELRIRQNNLEAFFGEVKVPEETVVEMVRGQKKTSTRKFFPGYILVNMVMNEDTWHLVKETPKITGFVGNAKDPSPMSPEEVEKILSQAEEGVQAPKSKANFKQNETVKVIEGPFAEFTGKVEEVNFDKGKLKVLISIFGRPTPVELDFLQVEKV